MLAEKTNQNNGSTRDSLSPERIPRVKVGRGREIEVRPRKPTEANIVPGQAVKMVPRAEKGKFPKEKEGAGP